MHKNSHIRDPHGDVQSGLPERPVPDEAAATGSQKKYDVVSNRRMMHLRMISWQWVRKHKPGIAAKLRLLAAKKYPYQFKGKPSEEIDDLKS